MARRLPGIRQRMEDAALSLYAEHGVADTTVRQIADAAGTTERTFFRHFRDKIDVAFGDEQRLIELAAQACVAADDELPPIEAATVGLAAVAAEFDVRRDTIVRRADVISREPALREREFGRTAAWVTALDAAVRERGETPAAAHLAATIALGVFRVALEQWVRSSGTTSLDHHIDIAVADLRTQLCDSGRSVNVRR